MVKRPGRFRWPFWLACGMFMVLLVLFGTLWLIWLWVGAGTG